MSKKITAMHEGYVTISDCSAGPGKSVEVFSGTEKELKEFAAGLSSDKVSDKFTADTGLLGGEELDTMVTINETGAVTCTWTVLAVFEGITTEEDAKKIADKIKADLNNANFKVNTSVFPVYARSAVR